MYKNVEDLIRIYQLHLHFPTPPSDRRTIDSIIMKCFIVIAALIGLGMAFPANPYQPSPHQGGPYKEEPPKPFAYQYGVADAYSGTNFQKTENQNDYGVVEGSYTVLLPDGRTQIVTYHADHEGGFVADVKYEGQAQYPAAPKGGYGKPPSYN